MIFGPVSDVYELSVQLLASVEEVVEMASEMEEGARYPQVGFCFEEVAEVRSHDITDYTHHYLSHPLSLPPLV